MPEMKIEKAVGMTPRSAHCLRKVTSSRAEEGMRAASNNREAAVPAEREDARRNQ